MGRARKHTPEQIVNMLRQIKLMYCPNAPAARLPAA